MNSSGASDYYKVIKSPLWLREVHTRLEDGLYDNEYDFAWDIRLIFANCLTYNAPLSHLHTAALQLLSEFEFLLCDWVLNIQDASATDRATGPWDNWGYLKYFDAVNAKENFCRETGVRAEEVHYFIILIYFIFGSFYLFCLFL